MLSCFFTLFGITAFAYDCEVDGIYYNLNQTDKTATVTFKNSYTPYTGDVTIPQEITYNDVTYSVTSIGRSAFYDNSDLTSVIIPNGVTTIESGAFWRCSGLTSVTISNSVTTIGSAFTGCSSLTSITIPNSVTKIEDGAFSGCSGLTSLLVQEGNPTYDSRNNCNAIIETASNTVVIGCKNSIIPNSVTKIGYSAFWGCSGLTSLTIPNSVTKIEDRAFLGCSGLTSVTIPNSVTKIEDGAFSGCI